MKHIYKTKVKYIDVDRMGFVHNSKYLNYFEEARTELARDNDYSYFEIEKNGIILPLSSSKIDYKLPLAMMTI